MMIEMFTYYQVRKGTLTSQPAGYAYQRGSTVMMEAQHMKFWTRFGTFVGLMVLVFALGVFVAW